MRCAVDGCSPVRSLMSFSDTGSWCAASTSSSAKLRSSTWMRRRGVLFARHGRALLRWRCILAWRNGGPHAGSIDGASSSAAPQPRAARNAPRLRAWPGRAPHVVAGGRQARRDARRRALQAGRAAGRWRGFRPALRSSAAASRHVPAGKAVVRLAPASLGRGVAGRARPTRAPLTTKANSRRAPPSRARGRRRTAPARRRRRAAPIIGCRQARARAAQVDGDDRLVVEARRLRAPSRARSRCGQARRLAALQASTTASKRSPSTRQPLPSRRASCCTRVASAHVGAVRRAASARPARAAARDSGTRGSSRSAEPRPAEQARRAARAGTPGRWPARPACSARRRTAARSASARTRGGRPRVSRATVCVGVAAKAAQAPAQRGVRSSARRSPSDQPRAPSTPRTKAGTGAPGGRRRPRPSGSTSASGRRCSSALGVGADAAHQRQRLAVGADQDVLAVVERQAVVRRRCGARPPSCGAISNSVTAWPASRGRARRRPGRPSRRRPPPRGAAAAQRSRQCVRIAIHSLRSGVSDDALVQHLEVVGLDLAQQRAVDVGHHQPGLLRPAVGVGQQRERLVVEAVRALGLEAHQRAEALAVAPGRLALRAARCALTSNCCSSSTGR